MSYYGQNVDAKLYMGASTSVPLPSAASDEFTEVPLVQVITPPGWVLSVGTFNVLNDSNKRSIGGKLADQTVEGNIVVDRGEVTHQDMFSDMRIAGGQKRNWRIERPDNSTLDFVGFLSLLREEAFDATGDAKEHVFAYRISVDGEVTEVIDTP
jgi:hypothetical protein